MKFCQGCLVNTPYLCRLRFFLYSRGIYSTGMVSVSYSLFDVEHGEIVAEKIVNFSFIAIVIFIYDAFIKKIEIGLYHEISAVV